MGAAGVGLTMPAGTLAQTASADSPAPRERVRLADGWRFHLGHATDLERDFGFGRFQRTFAKVQEDSPPATRPGFNDSDWSEIRVPHDWAVALPFAHPLGPLPAPADRDIKDRVAAHGFKAIGREYPENSIGWYRRALSAQPTAIVRSGWSSTASSATALFS
jgi:beta-galactosidase